MSVVLAFLRRVETPVDKGNAFDSILLELALQGNASPGALSVYVGDSATDLLALLAADVGIIIGSNGLLSDLCN